MPGPVVELEYRRLQRLLPHLNCNAVLLLDMAEFVVEPRYASSLNELVDVGLHVDQAELVLDGSNETVKGHPASLLDRGEQHVGQLVPLPGEVGYYVVHHDGFQLPDLVHAVFALSYG